VIPSFTWGPKLALRALLVLGLTDFDDFDFDRMKLKLVGSHQVVKRSASGLIRV